MSNQPSAKGWGDLQLKQNWLPTLKSHDLINAYMMGGAYGQQDFGWPGHGIPASAWGEAPALMIKTSTQEQ